MNAVIDLLFLYLAILVVFLIVNIYKYLRNEYISCFVNKKYGDKYVMHINHGRYCKESPDYLLHFNYISNELGGINIHFDNITTPNRSIDVKDIDKVKSIAKCIEESLIDNSNKVIKAFKESDKDPTSAVVFSFRIDSLEELRTSDFNIMVEPLGPIVMEEDNTEG